METEEGRKADGRERGLRKHRPSLTEVCAEGSPGDVHVGCRQAQGAGTDNPKYKIRNVLNIFREYESEEQKRLLIFLLSATRQKEFMRVILEREGRVFKIWHKNRRWNLAHGTCGVPHALQMCEPALVLSPALPVSLWMRWVFPNIKISALTPPTVCPQGPRFPA